MKIAVANHLQALRFVDMYEAFVEVYIFVIVLQSKRDLVEYSFCMSCVVVESYGRS